MLFLSERPVFKEIPTVWIRSFGLKETPTVWIRGFGLGKDIDSLIFMWKRVGGEECK